MNRKMNRRLVVSSTLAACAATRLAGIPPSAAGQTPAVHSPATPPAFAATLEPLLLARMQELRIPGAIVHVHDPAQGTWTTAMGSANLATREPMQVANTMRIGSLTKTFTATAILQLVDQGRLRLDDPLSDYQPQVPNGENISIRQLLNMTSGLVGYDEDEDWTQLFLADPYRAWRPDDLVAAGVKHTPDFAPGEGWRYSNTNTILLGMIVEQLTSESLAEVFRHFIFEPLGMGQSMLPPAASSAIPTPHAQGYMFGTEFNGTGPLLNVTDWNPSWGWAAGSMVSTLHDLDIWCRALATGQLLGPTIQAERLDWVDTGLLWLDQPFRYGLGIIDFGGFAGHSGVIFGYTSWMGHQPETGATIIVLTNLYLAEGGVPPAETLALLVQQALFS